jgi:hypothetical protein
MVVNTKSRLRSDCPIRECRIRFMSVPVRA